MEKTELSSLVEDIKEYHISKYKNRGLEYFNEFIGNYNILDIKNINELQSSIQNEISRLVIQRDSKYQLQNKLNNVDRESRVKRVFIEDKRKPFNIRINYLKEINAIIESHKIISELNNDNKTFNENAGNNESIKIDVLNGKKDKRILESGELLSMIEEFLNSKEFKELNIETNRTLKANERNKIIKLLKKQFPNVNINESSVLTKLRRLDYSKKRKN